MIIIPIEALNAVAWTMTSIAILLTLGRFHIHWRKNRRFGWDDYFNAIALLLLLAFIATYQVFVPIEYNAQLYGLGLSDKEPTNQDVVLDQKLNAANIVFFFATIYAVKGSFLALYWGVFEVSTRFRIAWSFLTAYTILSFLATFAATFWICGSPEHYLEAGYCGAQPKQLTYNLLILWCVLNVVGDLFLMILPCAMLHSMLMPTSQKVGIGLVFSLVLVCIAFDILRTVYTAALRPDFQEENTIWALLEPTIAVIVCALPCYGGYITWGPKNPIRSFMVALSSSFAKSSSELSKKSSNEASGYNSGGSRV